jgi:ankyrin repeat protein
VNALLKAGARVNARDSYGMSPLLYAAWLGRNPAIAIALLTAGADPKARSGTGRTLVQYAEDNPILRNDSNAFNQLQEAMNGSGRQAESNQQKG